MPSTCFKKRCRHQQWLPCIFIVLACLPARAAVIKWVGLAGDGQWTSAFNWSVNLIPTAADEVLLDNSVVGGNYNVALPASGAGIVIKSILIAPMAGNKIQLIIPASSMLTPAFTATGPGYGITINNGGELLNASGATGGAAIIVSDSTRINNGGQYTHQSRSAHAVLVTGLSRMPGTEKGIFKFDAPGGGYTIASTNRTYGTLLLSAVASGGGQAYATSAASPVNINGDLIIQTGVTLNLDITAATTIWGDYIQEGGTCNLASQPNNNVLYVQGDFNQLGGTITETSTGTPSIELNGTRSQDITAMGLISNSVAFIINNAAGVTMRSAFSLPFKLWLKNGIVDTHSFLLTLLAGGSVQADSTSNRSFINGALRKEGLSAASHFLFPVGKAIVQRWLELKNVSGNYTVEFFKADPHTLSAVTGTGIHHISGFEYWDVQASAAPSPAATIALSFDNVNSGGVTDLATLRVASLPGSNWLDAGNTATSGSAGSSGSVESNSLNTFNPSSQYFTLASSDAFQNPLPLAPVIFNAKKYNDEVKLSWTVLTSLQPASFELQASGDGFHFTNLAMILARPNQFVYQYTDQYPSPDPIYYRLKTIEKDGSFFVGTAIKIAIQTTRIENIRLLPSIGQSQTRLTIPSKATSTARIMMYNAVGKRVFVKEMVLQAGDNMLVLPLSYLPAGVYVVTVAVNDRFEHTRLIKL